MEHTPGPWAVGSTVHNYVQIVAPEYRKTTDADHVVCEVRAWRGREFRDANASLISAAPELLDACRNALAELEWLCECHRKCKEEPDDEAWVAISDARAAIAKAEGRVISKAEGTDVDD